jgi:hypothetical protein
MWRFWHAIRRLGAFMDERVKKWRESGRYLPKFLRDFHDQKDTFKAIHEGIAVDKHDYCKDVSWVAGQCYVIDIFLWHMARHGYVLRKSDAKLPFDDIEATNERAREKRLTLMASALGLSSGT